MLEAVGRSIAHRGQDAEVIVVGGGPAGSTFAAEMAAAGHAVVLLDKARFPRHKACSDYVNPAGAALLDEMGVLGEVLAAGAHRMEAMIVHAPNGQRFAADYARAEAGRAALGLTRFRLDAILLARAKAAGVSVYERAHVRKVIRDQGRVAGVEVSIGGVVEQVRAPLVVGADGRNSVIARAVGSNEPPYWPRKTGLVAHYRGVAGLDRFGEMHVARHAYAGLAPLEDGMTNVALVAGAQRVNERSGSVEEFFVQGLHAIPEIAWKLADAERVGSIRGVGPLATRVRRAAGDGYLLVGDAASFLDPFTGDGVYQALRSAHLAAPVANDALRAGDLSAKALAPYRVARRRAFTAKRAVGWIVQGFVNTPPLMNYATERLSLRDNLGLTLSGVLGDFRPATQALSPLFLARLLRP